MLEHIHTGHVILNGQLMRRELARVPVQDRGFLNGETLHIAIRVQNAQPQRLEQHISRLADTLCAPEIALPYAVSRRLLQRDIATLCAHEDCYDALAHYYITPGESAEIVVAAENPPKITTLLWLEPLTSYQELSSRGIRLRRSQSSRIRGDRLTRLALGSSARDIAALRLAKCEGGDLAVIADQTGNLLQASSANLFAVCEESLITPHMQRDGVYPGVYRELVMECAARLGIMVYQEPLTPSVCDNASEFFVTSCALEVAPVRELDDRKFLYSPFSEQLLIACQERLKNEAQS